MQLPQTTLSLLRTPHRFDIMIRPDELLSYSKLTHPRYYCTILVRITTLVRRYYRLSYCCCTDLSVSARGLPTRNLKIGYLGVVLVEIDVCPYNKNGVNSYYTTDSSNECRANTKRPNDACITIYPYLKVGGNIPLISEVVHAVVGVRS